MQQWTIRSQALRPGETPGMGAAQRLDGGGLPGARRGSLRYSLMTGRKAWVPQALKVAKCLVI
jgi:hypothetical protein